MDKIDIHILSHLLNNCRMPDRQIGNSVGISGGAVKSRIQKMLDRKIIEEFALKIEPPRSEEHTSELQSQFHLVCRLLLEKNNIISLKNTHTTHIYTLSLHDALPILWTKLTYISSHIY